ncbi:MAG: hypothetical protein ACE5GY_07305 [Thermodesulfobacteriota bacterium]
MADLNIAIPHERAAASGRAREQTRPASRAVPGGLSFEWFLFVAFFAVGLAGAYESVTESYLPAVSLLRLAHTHGYLQAYPIVYEPSKGVWHPIGWIGSGMMVVMMLYTVRKRFSFMGALGSMRRWLSIHMFFGVMGPLLVTLHTTFKLHGLVATSFWCMITTMVFGILGRYIYVQIPRSITGAELGVKDIDDMVRGIDAGLEGFRTNANISRLFKEVEHVDERAGEMNLVAALPYMIGNDMKNRFRIMRINRILKRRFKLGPRARGRIVEHLRKKAALIRKKNLLTTSHRMLHYWHVFHIPLAIVMFFIMFLHIAVYYVFRPVA